MPGAGSSQWLAKACGRLVIVHRDVPGLQSTLPIFPDIEKNTGARIVCQRSRNIGVRRSSSAQSASSLDATGSICVASVAAMRNLAGRRFSATSKKGPRGSPGRPKFSNVPSRS
jgi:hypothetical protein